MIKFLLIYICSFSLFADSLTLKRAWEFTRQNNLYIKQQQLHLQLTRQQFLEIEKNQDIQTSVNITLEQKDRYQNNINNSQAYVLVKKNIYSQELDILKDEFQHEAFVKNQQLLIVTQQQKIELLQIFFDTLLADFDYQYQVENVAVMAVKNNHAQNDFDIGDASDVEILQTQTDLQLALNGLKQVESNFILNNKRLAHIMGTTEEFDRITFPNVDEYLLKEVPDFEDIVSKIDNNLNLMLLRSSLQNLKNQLMRTNNSDSIAVDIYSKFHKQAFETDKNGNYLFGVDFSMPIGVNDNSEILTIKIAQIQNDIVLLQQKLQDDVLVQILTLHNLKQQRKALKVKLEYRDFYLERARAKYEMELKNDIGNSMAQYTKTEYLLVKNKFDIVLAWHKLALLLGEEYEL